MPNPLESLVQIQFDPSLIPTGIPYPWYAMYAEKKGFRWKIGDPKRQILKYDGRIYRGSLLVRGEWAAHPWEYYGPNPFQGTSPYSGYAWETMPPAFGEATWNRAYARFKDVALGTNATWGATIAEGREALSMIGTRALQLATAYKALRKGNFRKFLRSLGINKPLRRHKRYASWQLARRKSVVREVSRKASSIWLEYWFGWAPIAGEMYSSVDVLTAKHTTGNHWGAASQKLPEVTNQAGGDVSRRWVTESGKYHVKTGADVTYLNPNLGLSQQLGLTNPLSIAWEVVPFSFVIDWFTNVGDVIDSLDDLYGVSLSNAYRSDYLRSTVLYKTTADYRYPQLAWTYKFKTHQQRRRVGLSSPVTIFPKIANFGHSYTRAASAVSLLVSIFSKH